jgi:hypothetical protein
MYAILATMPVSKTLILSTETRKVHGNIHVFAFAIMDARLILPAFAIIDARLILPAFAIMDAQSILPASPFMETASSGLTLTYFCTQARTSACHRDRIACLNI